MSKQRSMLLVVLVGLLSVPPRGEAIPGIGEAVYDIAVHFESITTAFMTTETVVNQLIDLTPLDEILIGAGYTEDMMQLAQLLPEVQGLTFEIASIQAQIDALFSLETAPVTSFEFAERLREINRVRYQSYSYAMRLQGLIGSIIRTVEHAVAIVDTIGGMIGTLQTGQMVSQGVAKLIQVQSELTAMNTTFQRAEAVDKITEPLIEQSLRNINERVWAGEP